MTVKGAAPSLDTALDTAIALSIEAGRAIMAIYAQDFSVIKKDDLSPLTEADMAAHYIIVAGLEKRRQQEDQQRAESVDEDRHRRADRHLEPLVVSLPEWLFEDAIGVEVAEPRILDRFDFQFVVVYRCLRGHDRLRFFRGSSLLDYTTQLAMRMLVN